MSTNAAPTHIEVCNLTMAYGDFVLQRDVSFDIQKGEVMVIMANPRTN